MARDECRNASARVCGRNNAVILRSRKTYL
jgi:hypothetical protein